MVRLDKQTFAAFPAIKESIKNVILVDNSDKMQAIQAEKLGPICESSGIKLEWSDKVDEVQACKCCFCVSHSHPSRGLYNVHCT